jgi:hypothetical protein
MIRVGRDQHMRSDALRDSMHTTLCVPWLVLTAVATDTSPTRERGRAGRGRLRPDLVKSLSSGRVVPGRAIRFAFKSTLLKSFIMFSIQQTMPCSFAPSPRISGAQLGHGGAARPRSAAQWQVLSVAGLCASSAVGMKSRLCRPARPSKSSRPSMGLAPSLSTLNWSFSWITTEP